jgi:hypothetical protein
MMKRSFLAIAIVTALMGSASADTLIYRAAGVELEMKKGAFNSNDHRAEQLITIKNRSTVPIRRATVECGFFHDDLLIGRDTAWIRDLEPGQDGYVEMTVYVLSADHTDCRFTGVER